MTLRLICCWTYSSPLSLLVCCKKSDNCESSRTTYKVRIGATSPLGESVSPMMPCCCGMKSMVFKCDSCRMHSVSISITSSWAPLVLLRGKYVHDLIIESRPVVKIIWPQLRHAIWVIGFACTTVGSWDIFPFKSNSSSMVVLAIANIPRYRVAISLIARIMVRGTYLFRVPCQRLHTVHVTFCNVFYCCYCR